MKDGQEDIDNIFKKRLEEPGHNLAYNEDDWDALEQMLDKGKKRPVIAYWLPIVSGIAAMLLLFAGWWFFKPAKVKSDAVQTVTVKPVQKDTPAGKNGGAIAQPANTPQSALKTTSGTVTAQKNVTGSKSLFTTTVSGHRGFNTGEQPAAVSGNNRPAFIANNVTAGVTAPDNTLAVNTVRDTVPPIPAINTAKADVVPPATENSMAEPAKAPVRPAVKAVKQFSNNRPQFAISVIASSDVTGVNSLNQGKVGSNFGAMLSVSIKKFTITTGAMYAIKPYATSFANYSTAYQFKTDPTNVTADCRMLDIPLNIGYQVYQKGKNKFALGTGLSSYFMLHENYKYTYTTAYPNGPANYQVANPKNYLLSTVNLNATFEHRVNSKFSLSVQPYMKLPLKAVGYSQVNLHTAGVAVGFNWNINSFTKPK
jgi:hypothetical protein